MQILQKELHSTKRINRKKKLTKNEHLLRKTTSANSGTIRRNRKPQMRTAKFEYTYKGD